MDAWLEDKEYSDDGKTLKYAPVAETEEYRKRVAQNKSIFKKLYEDIESGEDVRDDTALAGQSSESKS